MSKTITPSFENFYQKIKEILDTARTRVYQAANFEMVQAYWNIGYTIVQEEQLEKDRAEYGKFLVENLSKRLSFEYGKGFDKTNVWNIIRFYRTFPTLDAVRQELSWTHYRHLMRVAKANAREFYLNEAIKGNWSTRQLERQINSFYYERLLMSKDKKGLMVDTDNEKETMQTENILKDPFVLEFLNVRENEKLAEKHLESAIIDKLQHFLLELGNGFSFVTRQYRISADTDHFYIDLVFYNYILKCFLIIDLKTEKLTHQDIGQMDFYVRFFEGNLKQPGDNPTIGLILCAEKNRTIVKYSLLNDSKQIFASKYQMYFPTEKQIKQEIQREVEQIEHEKKLSKDNFNTS